MRGCQRNVAKGKETGGGLAILGMHIFGEASATAVVVNVLSCSECHPHPRGQRHPPTPPARLPPHPPLPHPAQAIPP